MEVHRFIYMVILLSQILGPTLCQVPRDEYTTRRWYYKDNLNLTEIPTGIPEDAVLVIIRYNSINTVKENTFSRQSQCRELHLNDNQISEIEPGAFNGLTSLEKLVLSKNNLAGLDTNLFSNLRLCEYLDLSNNLLLEIEPGAFNGLIALTEFRLKGWSLLERLYANMFYDLNNCKTMFIQGVTFREVEPGSFNGLMKLKIFYFNSNVIKALKIGMFLGLMEIEGLHLNINRINSIEDGTFTNLKTLRVLRLNHNVLETLTPGMFFGLESLETLHLEYNRLTALPADVFSHLPRPLELAMYNIRRNYTADNPLQCDSDLCWLKMEELDGSITWYSYDLSVFKPRCANELDWDNWRCNDRDVTTQYSAEKPVRKTTTKIHISEESNDNHQWISITVGAVSVSIIVTLIIVFICLKRQGVIVCQRAAPKSTNETTSVSNPEDDRNGSRGPFPGNSGNNRAVSDTGSGYAYPRPQSDLYEEARDSILETNTQSGYTRPI